MFKLLGEIKARVNTLSHLLSLQCHKYHFGSAQKSTAKVLLYRWCELTGPFCVAASVFFLFLLKASSCDQELQSALEEAKQPQKDNVFIPECAQGGLYKPVQCHPSTGYCWCVLVDTGRPIPGTSTR